MSTNLTEELKKTPFQIDPTANNAQLSVLEGVIAEIKSSLESHYASDELKVKWIRTSLQTADL